MFNSKRIEALESELPVSNKNYTTAYIGYLPYQVVGDIITESCKHCHKTLSV